MERHITAEIDRTSCYDSCLVANSLKKFFAKLHKGAATPDVTVKNRVADVRSYIGQLNTSHGLELSYDYLAAMEQSMPDTEFRYAVIHRKNVPVLFVYFQVFTLTSHNFKFEKNKSFVKGLFRFFLRLHKVRVLFSGNVLRNDVAFYCFNGTTIGASEAVELVASVAEKIAADEDVRGVILDHMPGNRNVQKWLDSKGYRMPWQDRVMEMDIDSSWTDLDTYVAALNRKYKTRAKKILTARQDLTLRPMSHKDLLAHRAEMHALFQNVSDNQSFVLANPGAGHFAQLKNVYGDAFEVIGFFHADRLVAFLSAFIADDAYDVYYVGLDYAANTEFQLYFNLLFAALERAIQLRSPLLKLGRTSFDAKASLGAKPREMNYLIKTSNVPGVIVNWFASYFSAMEDGQWKLRNPLKVAV